MSHNTFGHLFASPRLARATVSHLLCGDGCPAAHSADRRDIQPYLDKRRPGQSRFTTQRRSRTW
jgi:chorismate synthase